MKFGVELLGGKKGEKKKKNKKQKALTPESPTILFRDKSFH